MTRDYRLRVSLSKRVDIVSTHTSFTDKDGNPLSSLNTETARRLLNMWYRLCFDVLFSVVCVRDALPTAMNFISEQPECICVNTWIKSLDDEADRLIHGRALKLKGESNDVMSWLKSFFRSKYLRCKVSKRELFQLLRFPKRLTLTDVEELKAATEDAFFENVNRVEQLNELDQFTTEESAWISKWVEQYKHPSIGDCYHSGGSTADPNVRNHIKEKYAYIVEDPYTWKFCVRNHITPLKLPSGQLLSTTVLAMVKAGIPVIPDISDYIPSRVQFVPKSYKTYRSVAMESETRMFYQNGVLRQLRKCIQQNLSQNIQLENQERSRKAAFIASKTRHLATIDFSMASDSVSVGLFSKWFGNTQFGQDALLLRARSFEYEEQEFDNPIAFTMGSPLCFPVECLVFLAMAYATIEQAGKDPRKEPVFVYGDDVILPAEYAEAYMQRAISNGFLPNADKSYWQSDILFREACGMEAYDGVDITPIYVARKFSASIQKSYSSYVHMANAAYGRAYWGLRKKLIHWLTTDTLHVKDFSSRRRKTSKIKSFVTYSDNLSTLINEDSSLVYDPDASTLNAKRVVYRRRPYNNVNCDFKQKTKYVQILGEVTTSDKTDKSFRRMTRNKEQQAWLDFRLHYKPMHVQERYGKLDPLVAKLLDEPYIFEPEPDRGFEHVITRMAITIRPYETVE